VGNNVRQGTSSIVASLVCWCLAATAGCGGGDNQLAGTSSTAGASGGAGGNAGAGGGAGADTGGIGGAGIAGAGGAGDAGAGGTPVASYCTTDDQIVDESYPDYGWGPYETWPVQGQNRNATGYFRDQVVAFLAIVPTTFEPPLDISHLGFGRFAEVPGDAVTSRDVTVSFRPCDFESGTYLYDGIGAGDTAPGVNFTVNNPDGYQALGGQFNVNSGDTFYFNIRNRAGGGSSCDDPNPDVDCDVLFDFASPNRY
jgi:hypothetical protein